MGNVMGPAGLVDFIGLDESAKNLVLKYAAVLTREADKFSDEFYDY